MLKLFIYNIKSFNNNDKSYSPKIAILGLFIREWIGHDYTFSKLILEFQRRLG